jgi:NADH-quinone oxidoreductase subunit J
MAFGVMLTRRHDGRVALTGSAGHTRGALVAAALFGVIAATVARGDVAATQPAPTTAELGTALVTTHVLAFEVLSFLLLAAIVGAIVIARRRDPGAPPPPAVPRAARPLAKETEA